MKEMLGGCSVCCDDTGWTENPLVYCDGPNCNVAVHQACYGIRTVPKGEWFCRKCEAFKDKSVKVKCELCPSKDGALKPTENGNWAHVVCALYIPEVTFMDVTTMEPVKLSAIPRDRFNRLCYICEENNKGAKITYGACMSCNKSGCKLGFHVTCAQSAGLLCEEAGNYYDNVKYVGYCIHHYSKLKKSNNKKPNAPYRPQNLLENAPSNFSSEKQLSLDINNTDPQTSKLKKKLTIINNFGRAKMDAMTKEGKLKKKPSVINSLSMDNTQKEFESRTSALHMLGNSLNPTSSMAQEMADILNEEIETHKICNNEPNSSTNTRVNVLVGPQLPRQRQRPLEIGDSSNGFNVDANLPLEALLERQWQPGREYMEQAQHFDIASLIACMYQLQNVENVALEKELDTITRRRDYLLAQSAQLAIPLAPQSSRNQAPAPPVPNNYNEGSIQPSKSNVQLNYGNIDPSLQARRPAQNLSNNKPSQIDIREGVVHDSRSGSRIQEIPTAQWSSSSLSSNEININGDQNLEDLLESHGEQGEEFLMEQAQHFNIPSILSSLSKLKKEIVTVEHKLNTFTRHYNHSLAVNSRQAKPNTPQSSKNQAPAHLVPNNHNEGSIQPSMSNFQLNDGNIEHSLQARHPAQNLSNNQSTVRSGNRINGNQRKILRLNSNSIASTQQSPNMTLPRHKYNTRCTIKKEFTSQ